MTELKNQSECTPIAYIGGENRDGLETGAGRENALRSGRREPRICSQDRMQRYLRVLGGEAEECSHRSGENTDFVFQFVQKTI